MPIVKKQALAAIEKAINHNSTFFAYSFPGEDKIHFGAQIIEQQIPEGFFIHPFVENLDTPCCFISAQLNAKQFINTPLSSSPQSNRRELYNISTHKNDYIEQVEGAVAAMKAGDYRKIVLSRAICNQQNIRANQWADIFCLLRDNNPNAFVFIFNSEDTGFWIGASPEKFLVYDGSTISTMALAGTRLSGDTTDWGEKEIDEQAIVAKYIGEKFTEAKIKYEMSPRYSRVAGNVEHLCNDFTAHTTQASQVNTLRRILHPTPAFAGIPTKDAIKFICNAELHNRRYYGGFIGPVDAKGNFDLYVNLRSAEFDSNSYCIYAGGGLTTESVPEKEWDETSTKAEMLLSLIEKANNVE